MAVVVEKGLTVVVLEIPSFVCRRGTHTAAATATASMALLVVVDVSVLL